jgi:hypothetical protein
VNFYSYDPERLIFVSLNTPDTTSDADYEEIVAHLDQLDRDGKAKHKPTAFVIDVDPKASLPSAQWRKRFADQRRGVAAPRMYMSVIARSPIARGVLTAMNWISPDPPHVHSVAHANLEESSRWIEQTQGTPAMVVVRLHEDAAARVPKAARVG